MKDIRIGIVGEYNKRFPPHVVTNEAISHAAQTLDVQCDIQWLSTDALNENYSATLSFFDAIWCAPGSPYKSLTGALNAIRFARESNYPFIGTCGGFQHVVLEYARNILGFEDASHAEYDPYASKLFVTALTCSLVGQTMQVFLEPDSLVSGWYGTTRVEEKYYCNFGLNPEYQSLFEESALSVVGRDQDNEIRILELPNHQYFIATLFVPQLSSKADKPHPLIIQLLKAALQHSVKKQKA